MPIPEKITTDGDLPEPTGVLTKSIAGGKWLTLGYVTDRLIGLISFFILARVLHPSDFGVMAIVLLVPNALQSFTDSGLTSAATQRSGDIRRYLDPLWSIQVIKSAGIALAVFFFGPLIASFFHMERAAEAIQFGGVFILIQNFANIGEIYFFKNLDFKKIFLRNTAKQIAYVTASITAGILLRSYWALVIGVFFLNATEAIATYVLHPYRPRFTLNIRPLLELVSFGKWIFGQGILDEIYGATETSVIGRMAGATNIGFYTKAKSMAAVVPGFLSSTINMVSFPAYAKIKAFPDKVREGIIKTLHLLFFVVIPMIVVMLSAGGIVIRILLGSQWLPMLAAMQVFAFYYGAATVNDMSYRMLSGIGHPDTKVKLDTIKVIMTITLLFILVPRYGIVGGAFALLSGLIPSLALNLRTVTRYTAITARDMLRTIWVPFVICALLFLPLVIFKPLLAGFSIPAWLALGTFGAACYIILISLFGKRFKHGPYETITFVFRYILV